MDLKKNAYLKAGVKAPLLEKIPYYPVNLVNDYGLTEEGSRTSLHDNHPLGDTMWLLKNQDKPIEIVFDFDGFYPIGEMWVWNYNRYDHNSNINYSPCGIREITLFTSIDGFNWKNLKENNGQYILAKASGEKNHKATNDLNGDPIKFNGVTARYVKMLVVPVPGLGNWDQENKFSHSFGLSKVKFFLGEGYMACPDEEWSAILKNLNGWTGSDGVFTIPMSGSEASGQNIDTVITFGDSLIDNVDPVTMHRSDDFVMIHNSYCIINDSKPIKENVEFFWAKDKDGRPESVFVPDINVQNDKSSHGYYWPQDSVIINNSCYTFPIVVLDYPEGPEGFQFKVDGVAMIVSPVKDNKIHFDKGKQRKVNLYHDGMGTGDILYGGCIFPNTKAGGAENPDGYIYVYGHKNVNFTADLCIARILEEEIENPDAWRFYDGHSWVEDISKSAMIAENVSCELSISKIKGRLHNGKYLLIFQEYVNSPIISYRIGESLWGPFSEIKQLYCCPEPYTGGGKYSYNAKGHPHLSKDGEMLISYNTNTIGWEMHMKHGDYCRPRFIKMSEIV
ncbi:MAG: DUF4185 domain-containing protein [Anaerolineaceae bacterium]|nr:MAG: DUF4185 domain-containing protein [Anaerolineaceae bacterium]